MKITIVGGLVIMAAACAVSEPTEERAGSVEQAIINGSFLDEAGEAMVKVQALAFGHPNCSGFVVAPQLVMTAAHCLPSSWASVGVAYDLSQQDRWEYGPSFLGHLSVDERHFEAEVVGATFDYDAELLFLYTADDRVYRKTQPSQIWYAGFISDEQEVAYPDGKTAADLLDVAYHEGYFYAYFVDGTITRGTSTDLSEVFGELNVHDLADGIDGPSDVLAVEFSFETSDGINLWYNNGRRGPVTDFGRGEPLRSLLFFDTHAFMAPEDLRAVAVNPTLSSANTYSIWRHPVPEDFTITNAGNERAASEIVLHPTADAALIRIEDSLPTPADGFVTIPAEYTPSYDGDESSKPLVTCHAYGNTQADGYVFGSPRSMTAWVTDDNGEFLLTFPQDGVSRLHSGDSGGECFVRGPDDEHELVGLVAGGVGDDDPLVGRLTSAQPIRDWFLETSRLLATRAAFASVLDETLNSTTTTQLRLVFQNTTSAPLVSPSVHYYFTSEGGKTPVVYDLYTPNSSVSLESLGNGQHRLVYSMNGVTLLPGEIFPDSSGSVFALHYSDWSAWDKSNDHSQPASGAFEPSRALVVLDGNGDVVGGTPPELPEPEELECDDLAVYVRDSQFSEQNITTPRFYLKNNGASVLADFKVRYHFTVENGKTPVLEDYYSPGCQLALTRVAGNEWYAQCDYAGTSLVAGATHPNTDGIAFSLHYANWSTWNKANDLSNPGTSSFVQSNELSILRSDGSVLCNAGG